jgi:DNA primase
MTPEDMEDLLVRLEIEVINFNGSEVRGSCPAHLERTGHIDHNPSWFINADTGAHICFSCGFKGSLYSLISYVQGIDYEKARDWIGAGEDLVLKYDRAVKEKRSEISEQTAITESMLSAFVEPPEDALISRGITSHAAREYEVLWDRLRESWILPVRDAVTGQLCGWQEKGYKTRHFNNYPKGMKKNVALFGYRQYTGGDMIVVESPLDVVRLASVGITGGVSTFGCLVSTAQINVIRGADRVIFAMDNDDAGHKSSKDLLKACKDYWFEAWFFDYSNTDCKDVGGMSKSESLDGLKGANHRIRGEKALT